MRNVMKLFAFEEIPILLQYLYMSEEHKILIHNCINIPLELYMIEDKAEGNIEIMSKNLNFPDLPPMRFTEDCHPQTLLSIIYRLKKEAAVEYPERFSNRWEEISEITKMNLGLNFDNYNKLNNERN